MDPNNLIDIKRNSCYLIPVVLRKVRRMEGIRLITILNLLIIGYCCGICRRKEGWFKCKKRVSPFTVQATTEDALRKGNNC